MTNKIYNYGTEIAPYPHKLRVDRYDRLGRYFDCTVLEPQGYAGGIVRVDPFVSGCLPEDMEYEELVGKTIEVGYVHGFIWLAEDVKIISD